MEDKEDNGLIYSDDSLDVLYDHEEEEQSQSEHPLTEEEIEQLISELLEVESKAAEAQEALEDESLMKVEADVRQELAQSLIDHELEKAVVEEMWAFKEEWETELDELETESAILLEQLDGTGIDLSGFYKWIEKQVPNGCSTEAWKKRTHWAGTKMSLDATESVSQAEEYLQVHRPVRRRHGKILEEGASGFLGKKIEMCESSATLNGSSDADWDTFSSMCCERTSMEDITFDSNHWASVYLASTPQQAAEMGLKFLGVNEVEEINDVDGVSNDPFVAAAIANERDLSLTEEQKRNFRKVKEEDDANGDLKLQICMKKRYRKRCTEEQRQLSLVHENGTPEDNFGLPGSCASDSPDLIESTAFEHLILVDSDEEVNKFIHIISSSDSGTSDSDGDAIVKASTKRRQKKKLRRIIDDAELGEETKKKVAIEKERQERLKSLEARSSIKSMMNPLVSNEMSIDGAGVEVPSDTSLGYIINLAREEDEEVVRIPPSISTKLKPHQIAGIRFMWENIIQSVQNVRSGDKGLGCILAHTMGLGKTFQVIAFLYTALRNVDLGLKSAIIVTPKSVLHNWRHEFMKWRPPELEPLRIFMLEDVPRERRVELVMKWRTKGGVLLIGYAAFRNLSLGKNVKDRDVAKEISDALQDGPDILVCDEAHIIKNTKADITRALKQVKCQRRIALTGSPLQNNLMEYYCMVDFVREGFLGSSHEFRNRFQNPIENGQHTNSTAEDVKIMNQRSHILHKQLKGFVQRMDSSTVKKDLPPKTVFVISVKLSPLQRKLYRRCLDVHGFTKGKSSGEKKSFFAGYQALAQIWNHPGILQLMKGTKESGKYEEADGSSCDENVDCNVIPDAYWWRDLLQENDCKDIGYGGKMVLLLDILTMCSDMGDKALVFSQSLLTLDLIEFYLSKLPRPRNGKYWKKGKDWYRLDGSTESSERQKLVERFNEPSNTRVNCTLISTRAGSLGINLYAANRVIIVDGSWNPTYDLQAIYRVWRYGQTKPVFAYRLMAHGTMEEKIYKRQVTKEGLAARVVDRQQVHRTMSKEEMLHLFDFGDDENAETVPELGRGEELPRQHGTSDKLMQTLISRHHPSWISNYHEHEMLLQENEDDRLSKEEQDLAWELYRKTINWEEGRRVTTQESILEHEKISANASPLKQRQIVVAESADDQKPFYSADDSPVSNASSRAEDGLRDHFAAKICTNHSHELALRTQGTKMGCSTICTECDQEISWEDLY